MSYCRFENTARALRDCVNAIQDNEVNDLSTYEVDGLAELQLLAMDIVAMQDEIGDIIDSNKERFEVEYYRRFNYKLNTIVNG